MSYIKQYTSYTIEDLRYKSGVYTITNTKNGKVYIGGAVDFYDRFRLHIADLLKNKHFNPHLQNAVNKYGLESFEFEIWKEYPIEIAFKMETYWIETFDSTNRKYGYNINKYPTRLGAVLTQKTKDKISNSLLGTVLSQETKDRISESNPLKRAVIQLDLSGNFIKEYPGLNIAGKELGFDCTNIVAQIKRHSNRKTCHNFVFVYKEDYDPKKDYSTKKGSGFTVGKYDLQDNLLETFTDGYKAAENVKGFQTNIHAACTHPKYNNLKTYKGFKWKYI